MLDVAALVMLSRQWPGFKCADCLWHRSPLQKNLHLCLNLVILRRAECYTTQGRIVSGQLIVCVRLKLPFGNLEFVLECFLKGRMQLTLKLLHSGADRMVHVDADQKEGLYMPTQRCLVHGV